MELVVVSVGILVALVVAAAVIDTRARRSRRRIGVDPAAVRDARRLNTARGNLFGTNRNPGGGGGGGGS